MNFRSHYDPAEPPYYRNHSSALPPQARRNRSKSRVAEWLLSAFFGTVFAAVAHGALVK